jgi:hypothetical protein
MVNVDDVKSDDEASGEQVSGGWFETRVHGMKTADRLE